MRVADVFKEAYITLFTINALAALFWVLLVPSLNPLRLSFWFYLGITLAVTGVINILREDFVIGKLERENVDFDVKNIHTGGVGGFLIILAGIIILFAVVFCPSPSTIPCNISEVYSLTGDVSDSYTVGSRNYKPFTSTMIYYRDELCRVSLLENSGGTPLDGYLLEHLGTGKKEVVYTAVNFTNGDCRRICLSKSLERKLTKVYPFANFSLSQVQVDDDGKLFWLTASMKNVNLRDSGKVASVIITDAGTGEFTEYTLENLPAWVDGLK